MISRSAAPAALSGSAVSGADYLASEAHYRAISGRIASTMREHAVVLVLGDPPPDPDRLLHALRATAERQYIFLPSSGECPASIDQLPDTPDGVVRAVAEATQSAGPVMLVNDPDALTDAQIRQICELARERAPGACAAVLPARTGFLARLEEPSLQWLREFPAAQLDFAEIGQGEAIDFLRHQLAVRHLREETRGVPRSVRHGLAAGAGLLAAGILGLVLFQLIHASGETSIRQGASVEKGSTVAAAVVLNAVPPDAVKPPEPVRPEANSAAAATLAEQSAPLSLRAVPGPVPSPAEIAVLTARGDGFLKAGDIASARLFYERAANAGDGAAALYLGATFDPGFLARAGIRGILGDPAQASYWYRRARDLGEAAAAERLKR